MKGKKKPVQDIIYVVLLLGAMFILFTGILYKTGNV